MRYIDTLIIAVLEAFAHWTDRSFGITAKRWQQTFGSIAMVSIATGEIRSHFGSWARISIDVLLFLWIAAITFGPSRYERCTDSAAMNPEKLRNRILRPLLFVLSLLFSPLDWQDRHNLWFQAYCLSWYFATCDDLPPSVSRLKKWLHGFTRHPRLALDHQEQE